MASKCKVPKSQRKEICECILILNAGDQIDSSPLRSVNETVKDGRGESERSDSSVSDVQCRCVTAAKRHSPYPFTWVDVVVALFSIIFYLLDIGSDSWLAWTYYNQGRWTYFGLTLAFLCVPSLVMNFCSFCWFFADYKAYKKKQDWGHSWCFWLSIHVVCCIFQMGPVLR